ncbi:YdgA family protein [Entomohabitans teleogrylli]|uniref:YdgA family protein n=1 Tax=Entomohabitans teleogrylli TaxID=1384589 RepID=UPI00073D50C2|nr:YdgA family protein [Entomohabitans teleogrylli]
MKKSLVAVSVVVALGVVWTGGSWYTGKQIEARMAEMAAQANSYLKTAAPESGLEISYQNYQRGVFSSQTQLVIQAQEAAKSSWLQPGQQIVLDEHIDHGPFPLAQLKSFNLLPAMASVQSQLANTSSTKQLFALTKDKSLFDARTRIGYSGDTSTDIALIPFSHQENSDKVTFDGGQLNIDLDNTGNAFTAKGNLEGGVIHTVNQYGQQIQVTLSGLKIDSNARQNAPGLFVGEQRMLLGKMAVSVEGKELAVVDDLAVNTTSLPESGDKHLGIKIDYALASLKLQNRDLGSGKLTVNVNGLNIQALRQFSEQYNAQIQTLLAQPGIAEDQEAYQAQVMEVFKHNFPVLLKDDPTLSIAPLSWKNARGESTLNLSLQLRDPATVTAVATTPDQLLNNSVKNLDAKLAIPMDMASELMGQVARLEGYQDAEADKLAAQQVQGLAAMGQMFRLTTTTDNVISSSLQFSDGKVTLNGQTAPLMEFLGQFGLSGDDLLLPSDDGADDAGETLPASPQEAAPAAEAPQQ